jgi:AraC family transcriptional regulator
MRDHETRFGSNDWSWRQTSCSKSAATSSVVRFDAKGSKQRRTIMNETMNYQTIIRETPAIKVAALPHRGDYKQIARTFEQLAAIAASMNLFGPSTRSFGIYYDNPATTAPDALRSDACLTVPEDWSASGQLELREIRGGRNAVTLHVGPYPELGETYKWLYRAWLPQSGEALANGPIVEEYLNDARTVPPNDLRTEIWLPLR